MGETVHCGSFLSSMRDLSDDSNSCSWSMYHQTAFSVTDFLKQTMLQHEAQFKHQVYELHRLFRTQKSLMDQVKGHNFIEHMYQSEHTLELPVEVRPVKVRRKMIDLELPADEYLDTDENPSFPPYDQPNAGFGEKLFLERGNRKLSGKRAYFELEACHINPEVSYDSYVESSVASNAHGYHTKSVRPWSHLISSWETRSSSSVQKSLPLQARADSRNFDHLNTGSKRAVTNGSFSEASKHQSLVSLQGPKECSAGLPWMKSKPPNKNETTNVGFDLNASANQFMDGSYVGDCLNNISPPNSLRFVSCCNEASFRQIEMADSHRKIEVNTLGKRNLDINLPCEAAVVDNEEGKKKTVTYKNCIDLNLCASEDEDSGLCSNSRVETKATTLIDLEALPRLESEEWEKSPENRDEGEAGDSVDELIKAAAEAIVTISLSHQCCNTDEAASSSTDAVAKDPLSWFVNTIASCGSDLEKKTDSCLETKDCESCPEECSSMEFDYFEAMTLNLTQTEEEDYMPEPLLPEYLQFDAAGSVGITANRPRRGQPRRGRPRRDFERDVLPGLHSLSKLEVTEDLQMFRGLMKARSYNSYSGVAQSSSNRGRKRLASNRAPVCSSLEQPLNNKSVQMVGLEDKSFTGWGNTSRRPRRQRCPASTPPTVILT